MLLKTLNIAIVVGLLSPMLVGAEDLSPSASTDELAYRELKSAILRSSELDLDRGALILTLGYADNPTARRVLIELADYYLGSAASESMSAAVSMHGESIVPDIEAALDRESACDEGDEVTCLSAEDRAQFLESLNKIASSGEVVEYVW